MNHSLSGKPAKFEVRRMHMQITRSRDCACVIICNLEIGTQSQDSENALRNLEIAQIPRLRGTYTTYKICVYMDRIPSFCSIWLCTWFGLSEKIVVLFKPSTFCCFYPLMLLSDDGRLVRVLLYAGMLCVLKVWRWSKKLKC